MQNGIKIILSKLPDESLRPKKSITICTLDETNKKLVDFLLNNLIKKSGITLDWFDGKYGLDCIDMLYQIMEHMFSSENDIFYMHKTKEPGWENFDQVKTAVIRMYQIMCDTPFCKIKLENV